jgi:hypothetical protein
LIAKLVRLIAIAEEHDATLDVLEFAEGAIIDAIGCDDGLDGASGFAVLETIWPVLAKHDRKHTTADIEAELRQYQSRCPPLPVSTQNGRLRAIVEPLEELLALGEAVTLRLPHGSGHAAIVVVSRHPPITSETLEGALVRANNSRKESERD